MTMIGRDRPGLVELVAATIAEHGGNWLESRMCRLGGEFAGILRFEVSSERQEPLQTALKQLERQGLVLTIQSDQTTSSEKAGNSAILDLVGQDRPGIVRQITHALARYGVNVEELETECESAPMSGETLFKAHIAVFVPDACPLSKLQAELETIAGDLLVDISFKQSKKS